MDLGFDTRFVDGVFLVDNKIYITDVDYEGCMDLEHAHNSVPKSFKGMPKCMSFPKLMSYGIVKKMFHFGKFYLALPSCKYKILLTLTLKNFFQKI